MLYYRSAVPDGSQPASLHTTFNQEVKSLGVECTGAKDGHLFFRLLKPSRKIDMDRLSRQIVELIGQNAAVAAWVRREGISKIAIQ